MSREAILKLKCPWCGLLPQQGQAGKNVGQPASANVNRGCRECWREIKQTTGGNEASRSFVNTGRPSSRRSGCQVLLLLLLLLSSVIEKKKTLQKMTNSTHNLNQPKKKWNYEKKNIKKDNTVKNESSTADNSAKPKGSNQCVHRKRD